MNCGSIAHGILLYIKGLKATDNKLLTSRANIQFYGIKSHRFRKEKEEDFYVGKEKF